MAELRDQIGAELTRVRELQDEIGLEPVRDDRVIEIRLGDVILRPWRNRTLVITDEGRQLEPFSGGAALNDVTRYAGRMWRTTPANRSHSILSMTQNGNIGVAYGWGRNSTFRPARLVRKGIVRRYSEKTTDFDLRRVSVSWYGDFLRTGASFVHQPIAPT